MANVFSNAPKADFPFSIFDLSYSKRFQCDMGELIPVYEQEVYPGEKFKVGVAFNIKTLPLVAPVMGDIDVYFHYFFVPYRLLQNRFTMAKYGDHNTFEDYITGQDSSATIPYLKDINFYCAGCSSAYSSLHPAEFSYFPSVLFDSSGRFSLADYFGFPLSSFKVSGSSFNQSLDVSVAVTDSEYVPLPLGYTEVDGRISYGVTQFLWRAYGKIISDFYSDENLDRSFRAFDTVSAQDSDDLHIWARIMPVSVALRSWRKDYFTSALPWQQKGTPVAFNVQLSPPSTFPQFFTQYDGANNWNLYGASLASTDAPFGVASSAAASILQDHFSSQMSQVLSGTNITSFDISDLRLVNAVQSWMERNAQAGTRFVEYLDGQFGYRPRDDEVDRAQYLGGYRAPLLVQQVQQTSSTFSDSTAQGTLTGQGYSIDSSDIFTRRFYEHGVIMGLMSIMPQASYSDGIDRNWIKKDIYDWHVPVFNNLSEEAIYKIELSQHQIGNNVFADDQIFGYQMRKGYMRWRKNLSCGGLDPSGDLGYWSIQRDLRNGASLNSSFIACKPEKNFLAYPDGKTFVCEIGNLCKAARQLPYVPEPSLRTYY